MRVKSRKPEAANCSTWLARLVGQVVCRAADGERDQMRQVADDGQHAVVVGWVQHADHAAHAAPQGFDAGDGALDRCREAGSAGTSGLRTGWQSQRRGRNARCRPGGGLARSERRLGISGPTSRITDCLVLPTSETMAPVCQDAARWRRRARRRRRPGAQRMTQSAPQHGLGRVGLHPCRRCRVRHDAGAGARAARVGDDFCLRGFARARHGRSNCRSGRSR